MAHLDVCVERHVYVAHVRAVFCSLLVCVSSPTHLWLITRDVAEGSSVGGLMKPGLWLIGDTVVRGKRDEP